MKFVLVPILFLAALRAQAHFTDDQAITAIVGEAAGEGSRGMLAVAEAIRNRGTLHGVYGLNAKHKESPVTWKMAREAWIASKNTDTTHGATHWGSDADLKSGIYDCMTKTTKIGHHTFFK